MRRRCRCTAARRSRRGRAGRPDRHAAGLAGGRANREERLHGALRPARMPRRGPPLGQHAALGHGWRGPARHPGGQHAGRRRPRHHHARVRHGHAERRRAAWRPKRHAKRRRAHGRRAQHARVRREAWRRAARRRHAVHGLPREAVRRWARWRPARLHPLSEVQAQAPRAAWPQAQGDTATIPYIRVRHMPPHVHCSCRGYGKWLAAAGLRTQGQATWLAAPQPPRCSPARRTGSAPARAPAAAPPPLAPPPLAAPLLAPQPVGPAEARRPRPPQCLHEPKHKQPHQSVVQHKRCCIPSNLPSSSGLPGVAPSGMPAMPKISKSMLSRPALADGTLQRGRCA